MHVYRDSLHHHRWCSLRADLFEFELHPHRRRRCRCRYSFSWRPIQAKKNGGGNRIASNESMLRSPEIGQSTKRCVVGLVVWLVAYPFAANDDDDDDVNCCYLPLLHRMSFLGLYLCLGRSDLTWMQLLCCPSRCCCGRGEEDADDIFSGPIRSPPDRAGCLPAMVCMRTIRIDRVESDGWWRSPRQFCSEWGWLVSSMMLTFMSGPVVGIHARWVWFCDFLWR